MDKKKAGLLIIVLFLIIGLGSFVFANPDNEENFEEGDIEERDRRDADSKDDNDDEEESETLLTNESESLDDSTTNNNTLGNSLSDGTGFTTGPIAGGNNSNGNSGSTIVPVVPTDYYASALKAVENAESSLAQGDVDYAASLVDLVTNQSQKEELNNRLEAVQDIIDVTALLDRLETMVNDSTNRDDILDSISYRDDEEIEKLVNDLTNGNAKDNLVSRLETVNKILNDNGGPVISGILNNSFTKEDVSLTITDTNEVKITVTLNGKEIDYTDTFTEEGTYVITAEDAAFNETTLTFTIDKHIEDAKWVYILNLSDKNNRKTIRNGQTLRVEVNFDEELTELPVLTIGNLQSTTFRECSETDYGKYVCVADITIDNTVANLEDGEIPFTITNIYDKAGNTITLDNANVTETKEYGQVTYDGTAPVIRSLGIVNLDEFKDEVGRLYAKTGDTVRVRLYFDEELGTEPTVKLGGKEFTATYREDSPKYAYYADIELTEDMNLSDGILSFEVYGYKDAIGNVGVNLTQDNINETAYPSVTIDNTLPALNFHNGFITSGYTVEATDDNFAYMTVQYYDGRGTETIESNTFTLDKEGDNVRYKIRAYDKAGNVSSDNCSIYLDNVAPSISNSIAINGGKKTTLENNGIYQKVTLNISDGSLKKVVIVKEDSTEEVLATYEDNFKNTKVTFEKEYTEEGTYTIKAVDRNNNETTVTFTIDKTPATRVYSTLDFDKSGKQYYEINKEKVYYVKNGDSFVFRMQFSEELKTAPTVEVGGMKVPMTLNEKFLNNEGKYIYEGTVNITEEAKLSQGRLEIVLSNVVDMAGNESTDEVVLNQTPASNSRVAIYDVTSPKITLNGESEVSVELNSEYTETGKDGTWTDAKDNKVDTSVLGQYKIWYTAKDLSSNVSQVTRIVKVVDTTAPVITLNGESEVSVELYSEYKDEGAETGKDGTWTDAKDNKVDTSVLGQYKIWYTAKDSSSNVSQVTRIVKVVDTTAPVYRDLGIYGGKHSGDAWYVTNGDKVYINVHFNEKLAVSPYVKVNGKDIFQYGNPVEKENDKGEKYYIYSKVYNVDEQDGNLSFEIYGYADEAGNIGKTLTAADAKVGAQNGNIIVDNTMPKVDIGGTTGNKYWFREQVVDVTITEANLDSVYYALNSSNNENSMHNILDSDKAIKVDPKNIIDNGDGTYTAKVTINEEGRYMLNIKAIDKAGNTTYSRWGWYQIDRTDPTIVLHKNSEENSIEPGIHNYCVSATVSDKNIKTVKLNDADYESDEVICGDGAYTLTATDKAGNPNTINFTIDRTKPVITINDVDYIGSNNEKMFYNKVDFNITEASDYTLRVNNKNVTLDEAKEMFTKDGDYSVEVKDAAINKTTVKFTVDTIPVALVNIRVNSNNTNKDVAKVGDTIGVYLNVNEELRENPTFTINGKEYKVNETRLNNGSPYTYAVTYKVTDDMEEGEVQFTISNIYDKAGNQLADLSNDNTEQEVVIDKTAPTISINNWKDLTFQIGDTYEDEGATATDNIDGDITDKIEVSYLYYDENGKRVNPDPKEIKFDRVGEFVIKYIATDRAGNRREAARRIKVVKDNEAPILKGVESGQTYHGSIHYEMSDNSGSFKLYYDLGHNYQTCEELIANGATMGTITGSYVGDYQVPGDYDNVSVCLVDESGKTTFRNNITIRVN